MIALALGTLLTLGALAFVLFPLFREPWAAAPAAALRPSAAPGRNAGERALDALREVEFDRATGKLSAEDYEELRAAYMREAVAAMRADEAGVAAAGAGATAGVSDDDVEAMIRRYRGAGAAPGGVSCVACGPRPEPDAIWCSGCGQYLAGVCPGCGAPVSEAEARYCSACGGALSRMRGGMRAGPAVVG